MVWESPKVPETLSGGPPGQNYFNNHTQMLFVFLYLHSLMIVQWNFPEAA